MTTKINQNLLILNNIARIKFDEKAVEKEIVEINKNELNDLWIGKATLVKLLDNWINTIDDVKKLTEDELKKILPNPLMIKSLQNALENKI